MNDLETRLEKALDRGDREDVQRAAVTREAKPCVKWAGGKCKLLPVLRSLTPPGWNTYREPFLGGGAFFFSLEKQHRAVLSDANQDLTAFYEVLRENVEGLIRELHPDVSGFENTRECYERVRASSPVPDTVQGAARFLYLNRHGFNGLFRVNKAGKFNVPFGKYKTVTYDEGNLRACARLLRHVDISCGDFSFVAAETRLDAKRGDFVYFDPPYPPASKTANFASYTAEKFGVKDHERLAALYLGLGRRGVRAMLSIADVPLSRSLYEGYDLRIIETAAPRAISCKVETRGLAKELVILNYNDQGECIP